MFYRARRYYRYQESVRCFDKISQISPALETVDRNKTDFHAVFLQNALPVWDSDSRLMVGKTMWFLPVTKAVYCLFHLFHFIVKVIFLNKSAA